MHLAQNISKRILKKEHTTSSGTGKTQPPRHLAKFFIWRGGLDIFDTDPQLNYIIDVSDRMSNILWICSRVFEIRDHLLFGSTHFFTPYGGFLLKTLLLGMLHCLFFQGLKGHRFLDVSVKFLV